MITHKCIVARFQAGESVAKIAESLGGRFDWFKDAHLAANIIASKNYVEHALRQVMRRQHEKHDGRR